MSSPDLSMLLLSQLSRTLQPPIRSPPYTADLLAVKLSQINPQLNAGDVKLLVKQEVDGECIPFITESTLAQIGIPTVGRRIKLLKSLQNIYAQWLSSQSTAVSAGSGVTTPTRRQSSTQPAAAFTSSLSSTAKTSVTSSAAKRVVRDSKDDIDSDNDDDSRGAKKSNKLEAKPATAGRPTSAPAANTRIASPTRKGDDSDIEIHSESEVESDTEIERTAQRATEKPAAKTTDKAKPAAHDDDDIFATDEVSGTSEYMAVKPWLGAIVAPSHPPKNDSSAPDSSLKLEWVHGYRSFDSRSNLFYNGNNEIVYPAAAVVVVYNSKKKTQRYFTLHNDDIRCLAQSPKQPNMFVSGQNSSIVNGKSSPAYIAVWDSSDMSKNWILKGASSDRAIRSVTFTADGKYVISVSNDDNHTVKVWDWQAKNMVASAKGDNNPIYQVKANHREPKEFVTVGKRHAVFWTFDNNKLSGKRASVGANGSLSFYSAAYSEKGYACLGADDGGIYVFVSGKPAKVFSSIHKGKVLSIDWYPGGIVTGGSDNACLVLDKKMEISKRIELNSKVSSVHIRDDNLLIGTMNSDVFEVKGYAEADVHDESHLDVVTRGHSDGELWGVAVSPDGKQFVTCGEDNVVALWDIASHRQIRSGIISDKKGKSPKIKKASTESTHPTNQCGRAIAMSPNGKHIIVGCNNGEVAIIETKSMKVLCTVDCNKYGKRNVTNQTGNWIQVIQYSPSGHTAAVGTHGSVVVLLDVTDGYKPKGVLKASNSFITHLDWSADGTNIQTNDGAYELLFYSVDENDLKSAHQVTSATSMRDVKWASQTCVLNWPTNGVVEGSDGTVVNSVDCNHSQSLIVSGDDHGQVNLYRYPALKSAHANSQHAHSSHVVTVRFSPDERYVISTGGHDLTIMQWAVTDRSTH